MSDGIAPQTLERQRALSSAIIEKVLNDPTFRAQLVDAPEAALRDAGFLTEFADVTADMQADVAGYVQEIEAPGDTDSRSCGCCITGIY